MPTQREARDAKRAWWKAKHGGWTRRPQVMPEPGRRQHRRPLNERLAAGILDRWAMDNAGVVQHPRGRR